MMNRRLLSMLVVLTMIATLISGMTIVSAATPAVTAGTVNNANISADTIVNIPITMNNLPESTEFWPTIGLVFQIPEYASVIPTSTFISVASPAQRWDIDGSVDEETGDPVDPSFVPTLASNFIIKKTELTTNGKFEISIADTAAAGLAFNNAGLTANGGKLFDVRVRFKAGTADKTVNVNLLSAGFQDTQSNLVSVSNMTNGKVIFGNGGAVVNRTVTFKAAGFDDITRTVVDKAALTDIPGVPAKVGYTGAWDVTDFTSVTADMTVNAIYTPIEYTITFKAEGSADIIKYANYGTTLVDVPAVPAKSGFTGVWDTADFTNITGNMTVTAVYTAIPPTVNTITANITGKGRVFIDDVLYTGKVTLAEGVSTAAIKIVPNLGYTIETATLTDGSTGNILGGAGGTYNASGLSGDETLVVTFAPVAEIASKPLPCQRIFKEDKMVGGVAKKANTTFAAAPTAGIVEAGIYLEKGGVAYTKFGGPYFKSDYTNANGQYGIEFIGFESGSYTATPYVKYTSTTEAATLAGTSVAFVVE